jgi:calcium-activated chloride channel regulator 4
VTDGETDYSDHYIDSTLPLILERGVTVHFVAFSQDADADMERLAALSGGSSAFATGSTSSTTLTDAFTTTVTDRGGASTGNTPVLVSFKLSVRPGVNYTRSIQRPTIHDDTPSQ